MLENKNVVEMHGCIVCARVFNVLAVYAPDGRFLLSTVTGSGGGHCLPDQAHALVACDSHTAGEIEAAYKRWLSRNDTGSDDE
jgi:hypothetical protein